MKLKEIASILNGKVLSCPEKVEDLEIERVGAADMMSDVLAFAQPGMLLITGLNTTQVVRTASIVGISVVVIVRKKMVPEETIQAANLFGLPIIHSPLTMYTACGKLYEQSIKDLYAI